MCSINDFTSEKIEIEIKSPPGVPAEKLIPAPVCLHRLRMQHLKQIDCHPGQAPGGNDGERGDQGKHHTTGGLAATRTGTQGAKTTGRLVLQTLVRIFIEKQDLQENRILQNTRGHQ